MKYGNYEWPNVYEEAEEMIITATLIYHFAKLRDLAKRSIIRTPEKILHLPITALDAVETVEEHVEEIAKEIGNERLELLKSALHLIHQRCVEKSTQTSPNMTIVALSDDSSHYELVYSMGLTIVAFGDHNADKELVYAVGVDCGRKRIVVAFRGTITRRDFLIDANFQMTSQLNPLADNRHQDPLINLHKGFCDYLFSLSYNLGKGTNKFDEIMNIVLPLIEKYNNFRIYVTGHSLGGALATIFAFKVAASNFAVQKPITCVSVASPKVGGNCFRKAFQSLEEQGKLRHLRVANSEDPVPIFYPPASCGSLCGALSPSKFVNFIEGDRTSRIHKEIYYHVGVKLKLLGNDNKSAPASFSVTYARGPLDGGNLLSAASCTQHFRRSYRLNHHLPKEYIYRLSMLKHQLECVYLNDLYAHMCENLLETHESGQRDAEITTGEENREFNCFTEKEVEENPLTCWTQEEEKEAPHYTSSSSLLGERSFSRLNSLLEEMEEENLEEGPGEMSPKFFRGESECSLETTSFSRLHSLLEELHDDTSEEESSEEILDGVSAVKSDSLVEKTNFSWLQSSSEEPEVETTDEQTTNEVSFKVTEQKPLEKVEEKNEGRFNVIGISQNPSEIVAVSTTATFDPVRPIDLKTQNEYFPQIIDREEVDISNLLLHREGFSEEDSSHSVSKNAFGEESRDEAEQDMSGTNTLDEMAQMSVSAGEAKLSISTHHYKIQSQKINFDINDSTGSISSRQWCKIIPFSIQEKVCFCI